MCEIHQNLTVLSKQFHPIPLPSDESKLLQKLNGLYMKEKDEKEEDKKRGSSQEVKEKKIKAAVCGTVLTSYEMSLTSTVALASSKLRMAQNLIDQFQVILSNNQKVFT